MAEFWPGEASSRCLPFGTSGSLPLSSGLQGFVEDLQTGCLEPFLSHLGRVGGRQKGRLVWTRIVLKPWWGRAIMSAGVNAILAAPGWCAHGLATDPHESSLSALAWNVAGILLFGLLVAAFTSNSHRAYAYALAGLDPAQRAAAGDAS